MYAYAYAGRLLVHDDTGATLDAGRFVVVLPTPPAEVVWYWPKDFQGKTRAALAPNFGYDFDYAQYMQCWKPNTTLLRHVLAEPGARSQELVTVEHKLATSVGPPP
ncbi:MAG: hypothetical protein QOH76_4086 [Thermoleophilaceae bacterium]|nr:hypothetical protein [Thermoleophilaceae bacterium]